jgi:hypothetical protein
MSKVVVRLMTQGGAPASSRKVTLWWKGFMVPEGGSSEYTDSEGIATFRYQTDAWPGDELAISVEGEQVRGYHSSPGDYYEFMVR